jgi:hypothetical protein
VKVLALFGLALVIFAMTYSEHAKGAVPLTGQAVRVVWSPGDALPLHNRDQQKVRRVIDRLASDLSAKLEGGESDWGMVSCTRRLWLIAAAKGSTNFIMPLLCPKDIGATVPNGDSMMTHHIGQLRYKRPISIRMREKDFLWQHSSRG